jgi:hypothetical protein
MKTKELFIVMLLFILLTSCGAPATPVPVILTMTPSVAPSTLTPLPSSTPVPAALSTATPGLSAHISEVQGDVQAKQPADADFLAATVGMILPTLSQVRTSEDGRARLDLSSGTIIRIAPNSLFTLAVKDPDPVNPLIQLQLVVGQLFIILNGGSVDVETPSGVASVLGSFMSVAIDQETGDVFIQCLEGSCHIDTPAGSFGLATGRKARLHFNPDGGPPVPPEFDVLTEEDILAWLQTNPEVVDIQLIVESTLEAIPTVDDPPATKEHHDEPPPSTEKTPVPTFPPQ